jgi:hypothetical protein
MAPWFCALAKLRARSMSSCSAFTVNQHCAARCCRPFAPTANTAPPERADTAASEKPEGLGTTDQRVPSKRSISVC